MGEITTCVVADRAQGQGRGVLTVVEEQLEQVRVAASLAQALLHRLGDVHHLVDLHQKVAAELGQALRKEARNWGGSGHI